MSEQRKPWVAEREVDLDLACALVAEAAPELAGLPVERFAQGWDNTAYLVDGRIVFRFPRRELAVPFLENELRFLPILSKRLPLPIPDPLHAGHGSDDVYPWPFGSYALLSGRVMAERALDHATLSRNVEPIAAFLAALHAQPVDEWRARGMGGDVMRRLDPDHRIPLARDMLESLLSRGIWRRERPYGDLIETLLRGERPRRTLVHSDFDARHLLCDASGRVSGVIDWGDLHVGEPALDLSITWTMFPADLRPAFFRVYGTPDDAILRAARFRALHNSLHVLNWAVDVGARAIEASARQWLDHVADD